MQLQAQLWYVKIQTYDVGLLYWKNIKLHSQRQQGYEHPGKAHEAGSIGCRRYINPGQYYIAERNRKARRSESLPFYQNGKMWL